MCTKTVLSPYTTYKRGKYKSLNAIHLYLGFFTIRLDPKDISRLPVNVY